MTFVVKLSYGAGINSTALLLLMMDWGWEFEAFYVDHECDWPETREYVKMINREVHPVTILTPDFKGFSNLYDYCWEEKVIPLIFQRWCTDRFKLRTIRDYLREQQPCQVALGISVDEAHRAKGRKLLMKIENIFPLIDHEITRQRCREIIREHGLPLPIKSGCWFCPYQRKSEWERLAKVHPELYDKATALEARVNEERERLGLKPTKLAQHGFGMEELKKISRKQLDLCLEGQCPYCAY